MVRTIRDHPLDTGGNPRLISPGRLPFSMASVVVA
jgi:hypothetical protein